MKFTSSHVVVMIPMDPFDDEPPHIIRVITDEVIAGIGRFIQGTDIITHKIRDYYFEDGWKVEMFK